MLSFILARVLVGVDKRQAQKIVRTVLFLPTLQLKYEQIIKLFPDVNPSFPIVKPICIFVGFCKPLRKSSVSPQESENKHEEQHILQALSRNPGKDFCL